MRPLIFAFCLCTIFRVLGNDQFTEVVQLNGQRLVTLDLAFGEEIRIIPWDKNEISFEADYSINDDEDNDLFRMEIEKSANAISFTLDEFLDGNQSQKRNCWDIMINYTIYVPRKLDIEAETISADINIVYSEQTLDLRTISGDLDITFADQYSFDFKAKTISGEVYSDLDISYPDGEAHLRQIVGSKIRGRVSKGGDLPLEFETISGNIYLRKGS